jgi:phytoene dehydrogenase-like protein
MEYKYDYLFIGTGHSALVAASLLANRGYKVCLIEAHDIPGGYAQSFKWGDFSFCGQVHYIWGCGPHGKITSFLKHIGLDKEVTFELYDPEGYDDMSMPDGTRVKIPFGYSRLIENIEKVYPGQGSKVKKFTNILSKIRHEMAKYPDREIRWWEYVTQGWKFLTLLKYKNKTLQDVFNECGLSKEVQLVLAANAGDMMEPPERLSIFCYAGLFAGYNGGAYYPTKHYKFYIERLAKFITDHRGCHIFYGNEVTKMNVVGDRLDSVETKNGRTFTAKTIICNMDPQKASHIIGRDKFPKEYLKHLSYKYSPSGVMIYLGLKDANLRENGFGGFNIWHNEGWDMNQMWKEMGNGDFTNPWIFISTPTLHTSEQGTTAPVGCDIMEVASYTEYDWLNDLRDKDYAAYERKKNELAERMLDIVEKRFYPDLRKHIVTKVIGTASSNEHWVWAPKGNAYGATFTPDQIGPGRLKAKTPWSNFFWCNATSGYAGMHGTAGTGIDLYMDLTGDNFWNESKMPTDDELAEEAYSRGMAAKTARAV